MPSNISKLSVLAELIFYLKFADRISSKSKLIIHSSCSSAQTCALWVEGQ